MDLAFALAASLHILPGDWNAIHPSIRLEHDGWSVGAYYNSERRVSFVAGRTFEHGPLWAEIGVATGYSAASVVPFLRVGVQRDNLRFFVAPAATVKRDVGLVLGIEVGIGG